MHRDKNVYRHFRYNDFYLKFNFHNNQIIHTCQADGQESQLDLEGP